MVSFLNEEMTKTQGFLEFPMGPSWVGVVRKPKRVESGWGVGEQQRYGTHLHHFLHSQVLPGFFQT